MPSSEPYYCPLCLTEEDCGYRGILKFERDEEPTCDHHEGITLMEPVAGRSDGNTVQLGARGGDR